MASRSIDWSLIDLITRSIDQSIKMIRLMIRSSSFRLIPSKPLRHIDAALIYGNQDEVGQGIKNSGVKREDIFLVSKVWTLVAGPQDSIQRFVLTVTHHPRLRF
jgi:hypothetical protein